VPWTPAYIATALWLDAADASTITQSGGAVSEWRDKSGNSVNLAEANLALQPEFQSNVKNGLSAMFFNTTGTLLLPGRKYLTGSFLYAGNQISMFSVNVNNTNANTASVFGRVLSLCNATTSDFNNEASIILTYGVTAGISLYRNSATIASTTAINNSWCLVDSERNAGTGRISLNGGTYVTGTTPTSNQGIVRVRVGSDFAQGSADSGLNGYVGETIVVTGSLSDANRQRLQGYLAHKWGLAANLPSDHPFKNAAPTTQL
jgi:hypothetical protein